MRPQILLVFLTRFEECTAMLKGVAHYERTHQGWDSFLDDEARSQTDPRWLRNKQWDGVISRHTNDALVETCADLKLPLVDLNDSPPFPGVPKLRPDNIGVGHLGAEHFIERGFHHFAYSGFANHGWSCERRDGFVEALALAGHHCDVHDVEYPGDVTPFWDAKQISTMSAWLKKLPKPVAVMACNDLRAREVLSAAQSAGMLVPEEVAVLGANNDSIRCELAYPSLSSVATNAFQSGYQSAEWLAQMIDGRQPEPLERRVEALGVVTRPSSDILAINDKNVALALNFIRENASRRISVDEVLKHAFASRSQLEKKFRHYLGRSPQAEIRRVQVAKIKQLLLETDYPLKKIAELTGFEHVEYLSVVFKRITADSPGEYRRKNRPSSG